MGNRAFCFNCRKDVDYEIKEVETSDKKSGKTYKYIVKLAICPICKEDLGLPELFDYNVD